MHCDSQSRRAQSGGQGETRGYTYSSSVVLGCLEGGHCHARTSSDPTWSPLESISVSSRGGNTDLFVIEFLSLIKN